MEHRGKRLTWNIRTYRTLPIGDETTLDINNFWASLPMSTQDEIFALYEDMYEALETYENPKQLDEYLIKKVAALFKLHPYDKIMEYYHGKAKIKLPLNLKDRYLPNDDVPDLTYLRKEYHELMGLSILLKIMIPIWGTYIVWISSIAGTNFKEYRAAGLLKEAGLEKTAGYARLVRYISTYWDGYMQEHSGAAILAGLGGSEVPSWLLGNVLIRHVATTQLIQQSNPAIPPISISAIYNYIDHLVKTMDKLFGGKITEKGLDGNSSGDDDNTSVAENYKIKQEISEGIIVTHEVQLTRLHENILTRLAPDADVKQLRALKRKTKEHFKDGFYPTSFSKALCKWVLDPVVTAGILDYVNYDAIISAHEITYTLLKHWGFDRIALLIFGRESQGNIAANVMRQQITDQQLEVLNQIYPHTPNTNLKRKPSKRDSNVAVVGIRYVINPLYSTWWEIAPWEDEEQYASYGIKNRIMGMPADIETLLADLIIHLKTKVHPGLTSIVDLSNPQPVP